MLPQINGLEKGFPMKWTLKKAGVATLISNNIDFKSKLVKGDGDEGGKIVNGM